MKHSVVVYKSSIIEFQKAFDSAEWFNHPQEC